MLTKHIAAAVAAVMLVSVHAASAQSAPPPPSVVDCASSQLSLGTDDENGTFNGMDHGGTLLVVRNISPTACQLDPFVQIVMRDARGKKLGIVLDNTPGFPHGIVHGTPLTMGHGPVVFPLTVAAGAEATATLRWTSGAVFDCAFCVDLATFDVSIGGGVLHTAANGHLCGSDAEHLKVAAARFALDPR